MSGRGKGGKGLGKGGAKDDSAVFVYLGPDGDPVPPKVQHVQVHESVTFIPEKAFRGCMDLVMVELPGGLVQIHAQAFQGCKSLRIISIPSSVIRIDNSAFLNCNSLKDVELHEGLLEIGQESFRDCKSLRSISIPSSVRRIGDGAFWKCFSLKVVQLPEGIEEIGWNSFIGCESLQGISIPSSVIRICFCAFAGCYALRDVKLCEGIQEIGDYSFSACIALPHISIPSSVTIIGQSAFCNCHALRSVKLCEGNMRICCQAFKGCPIFHMDIPSSVSIIDRGAFEGCKLLRNISISPRSTIYSLDEVFEPFDLLDRRLKCYGSILRTKHRFDGLAIHELCFSCVENKLDQIKLALGNMSADDVESALLQRDYIGMTPLHVLSCMGSHDAPSIELIEFLVQQCPLALTIEDGWGDTPFVYLLLSGAPLDMMRRFLCQHYDKLRVLDFENVMLKLATLNKGISDVFLRRVVCTLRQCMADKRPTTNNSMTTIPQHDLNIHWYRIIDAVKEGVQQWSVSHKVFQVLVEASASKEFNCPAVIHHTELQDSIHEKCVWMFPQRQPWEQADYDQIQSDYDENEIIIWDLVRQYDQKIREAMSLVELFVWKVHLHAHYNMTQWHVCSIREHSRAKCGVGIIIPNVMSFL